jgi:hypothetical protein
MSTYSLPSGVLRKTATITHTDQVVANMAGDNLFYTCPTDKIAVVQIYKLWMQVGNKQPAIKALSKIFGAGPRTTLKYTSYGSSFPGAVNLDPESVLIAGSAGTLIMSPALYLRTPEMFTFQGANNSWSFILGPSDILTAGIIAFGGSDTLAATYTVTEFAFGGE